MTLIGTFGRVKDGWGELEHARGVRSEILVRVVAGGRPYLFGTAEVDVARRPGGELMHFVDGLTGTPEVRDQLDYKTGSASQRSMQFVVDVEALPMDQIRASGALLQDAEVDVWWWPYAPDEPVEIALSQADHVIHGKMSRPVFDEETGLCQFTVEDERFEGDKPFPPVLASTDRIAALDTEASGKAYPVVIGTVKKLPCLCVNAGTDTLYLVAEDPNGEFGAGAVTAMYDGDDTGPPNITVQGVQTDAEGDAYWRVTIGAAVTNRDVSADLTGHAGDDVAGALRFLLTHYSNYADALDFGSLNTIRERMQGVTLSLAINERVEGGVLPFIQSRLVPQVPIAMIQRAGKIRFINRLWTRRVQRVLRTDVDILRKTAPPTETARQEIFNSFSVRYGRSCFRGDHTGVVERNKENNFDCLKSKQWHRERSMAPLDAGDLADASSANIIADWMVETFSKMRVFVGYEVDIGSAIGLDVWDTVQVYDDWEGWDHGPLFKIIGIRRGAGTTIALDLVSLDDYARVYDIDRTPDIAFSAAETVPLGGGWGDGAPSVGGSDEWGDGEPEF